VLRRWLRLRETGELMCPPRLPFLCRCGCHDNPPTVAHVVACTCLRGTYVIDHAGPVDVNPADFEPVKGDP
jgi:hypothetical protein